MRLIAGEGYGLKSKVKTHSPLFYLHVNLEVNSKITTPTGYPERAIYIVKGSIELDMQTYTAGQMLIMEGERTH